MWMAGIHARVQQMSPNVIKNARRLYVGGLEEGFTDEELLKATLSDYMMNRGGCTNPGNPILSCKVTPEKGYAFVELRSVEETTNVLAFDGVSFQDTHLKIRRPSNYDPQAALILGPSQHDPTVDDSGLDICRSVVEDSPHKLFIGGLPCDWVEDQVKEILTPLGSLKSFNLVMDKVTGKSKGYAFCQFDEGQTDYVIAALNQKKVGNKVLTVKRALEGQKSLGANGVLMSSGMLPPMQTNDSGMSLSNQSPNSNFMAVMLASGMPQHQPSPQQQQQQQQQQAPTRTESSGYARNVNRGGRGEIPPQDNRQQAGYSQDNRLLLKQEVQLSGGVQQKQMNGDAISGVPNNLSSSALNPNMQQYGMNANSNPNAPFGMGANAMW
eukprot:TRINITY_DN557_c0_g1_i3.p1 TRINITY_DN557_c0_g1~~TRINITY_DN557_c0_g1_i3.p1  ORF type:complete len:382 (-),score=66.54 TRINITY_DN557_c0_g1_i3:1295-2440(-)